MNKDYAGSSFDDFLEEEGIAEEVKNEAIKRLISYNLLEEKQKQEYPEYYPGKNTSI